MYNLRVANRELYMSYDKPLERMEVGVYTAPLQTPKYCMVRNVWEVGTFREAELVDQKTGEAFIIAEIPGSPQNEGGWTFTSK